MNLIILDKDFQPLAPINYMQTLIWSRRYRDAGTFEIHCGAEDFQSLNAGSYIYRDDREEFGIIYEVDSHREADGAKTCYAKGYFGERLLNDRVLDRTFRHTGTPEAIARTMVLNFVKNPSGAGNYEGRGLGNRLILGPMSGITQTQEDYQATGVAVGDALYALEASQGLSHRVSYDYANDRLIFRVWGGQDRGALFSDLYGNLSETRYHRDETDAPNVAYVAGDGDGETRKVLFLDLRKDGESAREIYVDARDIQQTYVDETGLSRTHTDEEYNSLLQARGLEKVAEHEAQERYDITVDSSANLVYRVDYDLGDYCQVNVDGVSMTKQITGVRETYEAGAETVELTFGDYGPVSLPAFVSRQTSVNRPTPPSAPVAEVGTLSRLKTENKTSIVDAINEIVESGGGGGGGGGGGAVWPPPTVLIRSTGTASRTFEYQDQYLLSVSKEGTTAVQIQSLSYQPATWSLLQLPLELVGVGFGGYTGMPKTGYISMECYVGFPTAGISYGATFTRLFYKADEVHWDEQARTLRLRYYVADNSVMMIPDSVRSKIGNPVFVMYHPDTSTSGFNPVFDITISEGSNLADVKWRDATSTS